MAFAIDSLIFYRVVFLTCPPEKVRVWNWVRHQILDLRRRLRVRRSRP